MCWFFCLFWWASWKMAVSWHVILGFTSPDALFVPGARGTCLPDTVDHHLTSGDLEETSPWKARHTNSTLLWKKRVVTEICVKCWNVTCLWLKIHAASIISREGKFYFIISITQRTWWFLLWVLIYWCSTPACKMLTLWEMYFDAYRHLKTRIHNFLTKVLKILYL